MDARLRPRFRLRVDLDPDEVMERFTTARSDPQTPCVLHLYQHQVEFSVLKQDRHTWSPFLNLIVESDNEGATLFGKYGPNVNIWTLFVAIYTVSTLTGLAGLTIGFSQSGIGQETWGFQLAAAAVGVAAVTYVVGRIGRTLAHPQMLVFHDFVERTFSQHVLEILDDETATS